MLLARTERDFWATFKRAAPHRFFYNAWLAILKSGKGFFGDWNSGPGTMPLAFKKQQLCMKGERTIFWVSSRRFGLRR